MKTNPLQQLVALGQSIWLDFIKRDLIVSGQLKKLITEDSLRGMTSNPTIFDKAIGESKDYDDEIRKLSQAGKDITQIYELLSLQDVGDVADQFKDLYKRVDGKDGFVSLEVNPHLAYDTQGTIREARHLWQALDRPNVFIKVPATKEGLPAITQLISEGINVNVTLLFGLPRYREVVEAYLAGIEARLAQGKSVEHVASVASFFLSRIDVLIDPLLQKQIDQHTEISTLAQQLTGQIAIASANLAYQIYQEIFQSERFKKFASKGAQSQRVLWASTSTKNPNYSDVKYVEALIGPETINTLPLETINAYRDHGHPSIRLGLDFQKAVVDMKSLTQLGINIDHVTQQLEDEGVDKFVKSYDQLLETLKKKISKE